MAGMLTRLFRLLGRGRRNAVTEEEMREHFEMEVEAAIARGLSEKEARRQAKLRLGTVSAAMEEVREVRQFGWLEASITELRQAWTALSRRPGYLMLALGALGAAVVTNTLVFTILYGVLIEPLPYPHPERLVCLYEASSSQPKFPVSLYHFDQNELFSETIESEALYTQGDLQWTHGERAENITAMRITAKFFSTLAVPLAIGRDFTENELVDSARVVILSHGFWKQRLDGDPEILGKTLRFNRENWTVVGVASAEFEHVGGNYRSPIQGDTVAVWRPLNKKIDEGCYKGCHFTNAILRLKPGISIEVARQDLNRIVAQMAKDFPDYYENRSARLEPLMEEVAGNSRSTVVVLSIAGGCLLLLVCINVAGLSITRALSRRRELAVRGALGGGKTQLLRTVLAENAVLGGLAAVAGLASAAALLPALRAVLPPDFPRAHEMVLTWPTAAFAVGAAMAVSLLAGIPAALRFAHVDPAEALHEESRTSSGSRESLRLRGALMAAQMTLTCVLCFAAILLLRSAVLLGERNHGFDPAGVITFELTLPGDSFLSPKRVQFYRDAAARLREIPGVTDAGFGTSVPWTGYDENASITVPGHERKPGESDSARYQAIGPGYFDALRAPIVAGRSIGEQDGPDAPKAAMINEAVAARFFPQANAVGRQIRFFGETWTVVGVVADIRDHPADANAVPAVWMALPQMTFGQVRGVVRGNVDAASLGSAVRAAIAEIDPELPVAKLQTMNSLVKAANAERTFALWWCSTFAVLSMLLGGVGIYSLLAYSIEQRHREIGIRMALGAKAQQVLRTYFGGGVALATVAVVAGLACTPLVGGVLSGLLYGVSPRDSVALCVAALAIYVAAGAASVVPAWRAVRTEPASVLREQ